MTIYAAGPARAKVMLIGEAWGEQEEKQRAPFLGTAGKVLDGILEEVGLPRGMCHITNVMHERPPRNDFSTYYEKSGGKVVPSPKLLEAYSRLDTEIAAVQPNVIVPLGNEAMRAVLGHAGIGDWRGSVIPSPRHGCKVIPTIHPAALLREWKMRPVVVADFNKIAKEMEYGQVKQTQRVCEINPTYERVMYAIEEASQSEWCAFDIETESGQITCIGISYKLNHAICIPFWWGASGSFWSPAQEAEIWRALRGLLVAQQPKKIAHNAMYELEYLWHTTGILPTVAFDTMLGFHTLYPEFPKSLGFVVSLLTDHPFYKFNRKTGEMNTFWTYNATDAVLTLECALKIREELAERGLTEFDERYVQALLHPLFEMTARGVRFDRQECRRMKTQMVQETVELQGALDKAVGHPLNVGSSKQMTQWLYTELGLPKQEKARKGKENKTLTADDEALEVLYTATKNEALHTVLEIRERNKIVSTYLGMKIDGDNRFRCTYNIAGTETGRLSSSATGRGVGCNGQNIPPSVRRLFLPDEGKVLINADLSQAEARVVAYLAEDRALIEVFDQGGDIHKKNAAKMFNKPEAAITEEERYLAKRSVHGLNYGMGYVTFAQQCGIPQTTAKKVYNVYFTTFPRIKVWHMRVEGELKKSRTLTTPLGRQRMFFGRFGKELVKEGLAFVPQSVVADIVNQGIIALSEKWKGNRDTELLLQVHDSVVVQTTPGRVDEVCREIHEALTVPVVIQGRTLTIPVDFKVGENWFEMQKHVLKQRS